MAPLTATQTRQTRRLPTVIGLLIGAMLSQLDITLVGTAMPHISATLHDLSLYAWVFFAYAAGYTSTVPFYGMLADTIGRKQGYLIAMSVLAAGSIVCGSATSMVMLVAGRLVQGVGASGVYVIAQTILGDLFPAEQRARIQGAFAGVSGVSIALGPLAGGLFVTYATWRFAFFVNLPIATLATLLLVRGYVEPAEQVRKPVNWRGALFLTLTLCTFFSGIRKDRIDPLLIGIGAALAIPFLLSERRSQQPLLPPSLFANRAFSFGVTVVLLLGSVQMTLVAFGPLYLQGVAGIQPITAGYLLGVPVTVTLTIASFYTGKLIVRLGYRPVLLAGTAMLAVCAFSLTLADRWSVASPGATGALALLIAGQAAQGMAIGLTTTAVMICVQGQVGWSRRGTATAALQLMRTVGGTLGPAILGVRLMSLLAQQHLGVAPEKILSHKALAQLSAEAVAPIRAGLGASLRGLLLPLVVLAGLAVIAALMFPGKVSTVEASQPPRSGA